MVKKLPSKGHILALDVGEKRIGTALASAIARLPQPSKTIDGGETAFKEIAEFAARNDVSLIVVGVPRNLDGEETAQSKVIRDFGAKLAKSVEIPVEYADESLSSRRADELTEELNFKNISRDSLAACFILEEFLGNIEVS